MLKFLAVTIYLLVVQGSEMIDMKNVVDASAVEKVLPPRRIIRENVNFKYAEEKALVDCVEPYGTMY
eukprot:TRINITY_DN6687_c0_g1_i1.p1 TRINITY_DN6687_c0_g1~~TRINITY_DN6687_c0_g1_i1.p1  ORF type:complete len:67 (-),score=7.79 TRINITY_DN6687_c0_g1_i1:413-613(-)